MSPLVSWTIIADDLTGAADAVAPFGHIHPSSVILDAKGPWPETVVLAVDTESRYMSPEEAAAAVGDAVKRSLGLNRRVFKKIDSLLRGNIGVETAAAMNTMGDDSLALIAPAFPGTSRTTVDGIVRVDDLPHTDGHFGGNIAKALRAGALESATIAVLPGRTPQELATTIECLHHDGVRTMVLDATTEAHLQDVVRAAELLDGPVLLVGSGGLASHLLPRQDNTKLNAEKPEPEWTGTRSIPIQGDQSLHCISIIGSYSALSRTQLAALIESGSRHVVLDHTLLDQIPPGLRSTIAVSDVVLTPDPHAPIDKSQALAVAKALAAAALSVRDRCGLVVVSGGETAHAVLDALKSSHMLVLGQLEPGVVVNQVPGLRPLFITKAGAFGDDGTMRRIIENHHEITTEMRTK